MIVLGKNSIQLSLWHAILIIIGTIGIILIIIELIALHLLKKHNDRIDRHEYNVNMLLAQKYDILLLIAKVFKKYNVKIPTEFEEELSPKMDESLKSLTITERLTVKSYLMKAAQTLLYFAEINDKVKNDSQFKILRDSLIEIDKNHRKAIASYNADVIGFNFWISYGALKPIVKLMGFKKRDIIS